MLTCFKGFDLLDVNIDFYTCRQIEFLEFVDGLYGWLDNIDKPFVCAQFKLIHRFLVDVRGTIHGVTFNPSRHWNWTRHTSTRSFGRIDDIRCGLIYDPIIEASKFNSYALSVHLVINYVRAGSLDDVSTIP